MFGVNDEPPTFNQGSSGDEPDWMQVTVVAPREVGLAVREFLTREFGFQDIAPIDWCVLERREDYARVDYGPASPITTNAYAEDWRRGGSVGSLGFDVAPGQNVNSN